MNKLKFIPTYPDRCIDSPRVMTCGIIALRGMVILQLKHGPFHHSPRYR